MRIAVVRDRDHTTTGGRVLALKAKIHGDTISVARARELTRKNFAEAESAINRRVRVPLHQYEYDALVSMAYNAGPGTGIAELVDKVNTADYAALPAHIRTYRAHGIEWRRALEARLFGTGNYDARHGRGIGIA